MAQAGRAAATTIDLTQRRGAILPRSASSQSDDRNGLANTLHFESCLIHSVFTNLYARQYSYRTLWQWQWIRDKKAFETSLINLDRTVRIQKIEIRFEQQ
jgi:hypothetical protein